MEVGRVKWFNEAKGYGFIEGNNGDGDVFVHFSAIEMRGYRKLRDGDTVQFEAGTGPKGRRAERVIPASPGP
jgi:CspA family cold shock protein